MAALSLQVPACLQLGLQLVVDLHQYGLEETRLVSEVMMQRPARHSGLGRKFVHRHRGEAAPGKRSPCHLDQPPGGPLGRVHAGKTGFG